MLREEREEVASASSWSESHDDLPSSDALSLLAPSLGTLALGKGLSPSNSPAYGLDVELEESASDDTCAESALFEAESNGQAPEGLEGGW